jgi:hypothetical protein
MSFSDEAISSKKFGTSPTISRNSLLTEPNRKGFLRFPTVGGTEDNLIKRKNI